MAIGEYPIGRKQPLVLKRLGEDSFAWLWTLRA